MSKVLTFSRVFPKYHPKAGQPTYFVEKFWNGAAPYMNYYELCNLNKKIGADVWAFWETLKKNIDVPDIKGHTIRAGHRWKKGDYFSPRVWSGRPYNSPQITIGPDTLITDVWDFRIHANGLIFINNELYAYSSSTELIDKLANNDGLEHADFLNWFKYPKHFVGQIICWNPNIKY